ncbi:hypothetical protein GCM10010302_08880 [Streptomyces polychromogenes]|uniref:Uncharacterized protein n=1 Tax=Streptomyces polychromogenes TaxID=67342 RepID=A0ABP3ETC2_9ACTN
MRETTQDPTATPPAGAEPSWRTTGWALALIPVAFFFGALAPMAGDAHPRTVAVTTALWWAAWTVSPLLVLVSRLLPDRPAPARAGRWAGRAALVPPVAVILLTLTL